MQITISKQTAKDLDKALRFFYVSCTKASAANPDGIKELSPERMKILKITPQGIDNLIGLAIKIKKQLKPKKATSK